MPPQDFEFDLFLSHASEDLEWTERLAKRLRGEGVRVWLDRWQLKPGDDLAPRIEHGISRSRRMAVVWTRQYFAPHKEWTGAEMWSRKHADVLGDKRLLLPVWREDCEIPALVAGLLRVDFRDDARFEKALAELIDAIGLPYLAPTPPAAPAAAPVRSVEKSTPALDTLGPLLVPLLVFLAFGLACMVGLGFFLIQKGHVIPGCTSAVVGFIGVIGILIFYLVLRARGIPLTAQEFALARNAPQLLSDHAQSAVR